MLVNPRVNYPFNHEGSDQYDCCQPRHCILGDGSGGNCSWFGTKFLISWEPSYEAYCRLSTPSSEFY